jgi:TRAP-type mannitol/chloroaromatic compound transport system permease large subunit
VSGFVLTPEMVGLAMLFLLVAAIMIGFPTAFTLMALGVIAGLIGLGLNSRGPNAMLITYGFGSSVWDPDAARRVFDLFVQRTYSGVMKNDVLISVPLFLFMGYIIERAGTLDRLFRSLELALTKLRGSLLIATLLTCTIFATATGIVGASVTLIGLLALPAMMRSRYDVKLATGTIAAGGTLGILIPPSVLLILYGAVASVSVPRLYAAAFLPGLMLSGLYLVYILTRVYTNPRLAPPLPKEEQEEALASVQQLHSVQWAQRHFRFMRYRVALILFNLLVSFVPLTVLIVCVLGSILAGLATPGEAAAVGALGGLILAFAYGRLNMQNLKESVFLCARASAMVLWLLVGSSLFAAVFALLGGSALIERWIVSLGLNSGQFLLLSLFIIFILGWPLEWTEITIIFLPLFLPLLDNFGIDPLFFGIMCALNLQTAFLSPPVAMSAFYLKGVAPKSVTLNQIFNGMYPFMVFQILAMLLLWIFPQLATALPEAIYGIPLRGR